MLYTGVVPPACVLPCMDWRPTQLPVRKQAARAMPAAGPIHVPRAVLRCWLRVCGNCSPAQVAFVKRLIEDRGYFSLPPCVPFVVAVEWSMLHAADRFSRMRASLLLRQADVFCDTIVALVRAFVDIDDCRSGITCASHSSYSGADGGCAENDTEAIAKAVALGDVEITDDDDDDDDDNDDDDQFDTEALTPAVARRGAVVGERDQAGADGTERIIMQDDGDAQEVQRRSKAHRVLWTAQDEERLITVRAPNARTGGGASLPAFGGGGRQRATVFCISSTSFWLG